MILILIALVIAVIATALLLSYSNDSFFLEFVGISLAVTIGITALFYCYAAWGWLASEHKTAIINREYKTNYTREEIFWASNVIDTIREIDRKRIEVNGDLMQDSKH